MQLNIKLQDNRFSIKMLQLCKTILYKVDCHPVLNSAHLDDNLHPLVKAADFTAE